MPARCEASREDNEWLVASSRSSSRSTLGGGAAEAPPARRFSLRAASCAAKDANSLLPSAGGLPGGDFTWRISVGRGANRLSSDAPKGCKRSQKGLPCSAHQRCDQVRALPMPPHRNVIAGGRAGWCLVVLEYGSSLECG